MASKNRNEPARPAHTTEYWANIKKGEEPDGLTKYEETVLRMAAALIREYEAPDLIVTRDRGQVREIVTRDAFDMADDLWDEFDRRAELRAPKQKGTKDE